MLCTTMEIISSHESCVDMHSTLCVSLGNQRIVCKQKLCWHTGQNTDLQYYIIVFKADGLLDRQFVEMFSIR